MQTVLQPRGGRKYFFLPVIIHVAFANMVRDSESACIIITYRHHSPVPTVLHTHRCVARVHRREGVSSEGYSEGQTVGSGVGISKSNEVTLSDRSLTLSQSIRNLLASKL